MKKTLTLLSLLSLLLLLPFESRGDVPFRTHRYESFKALTTDSNTIVFAGNSITNMHEWWEAFGSAPQVVNRGNSGGYTQEIIDNLESYLTGRPKKMFLMIGTNDLGTSGKNTLEYIVGNIRMIARRVARESPRTQLYVQSILPSNNGSRSEAAERAINAALQKMCQEEFGDNVQYIDLWDATYPMSTKSGTLGKTTNSYDNLHPNAWGYASWCREIENEVGLPVSYPAENMLQLFNGGLNSSWGSRITQGASLPHKAGDIIFFGEEMAHQGEWHELLRCPHIKSRTSGWGNGDNGGSNMDAVRRSIGPAMTGYAGVEKATPSRIFLSAGQGRVISGNDNSAIRDALAVIIGEIRKYAPTTPLYVLGSHPLANASLNSSRVQPYNALVQQLCADSGATYVDIYTPMLLTPGGTSVDSRFVNGNNYVIARGYARLAEILATHMAPSDSARPVTVAEADSLLTLYNNRNALGSKISALDLIATTLTGEGTGQFPASAVEPLRSKIDEAYELLARDPSTVTAAALQSMLTTLSSAYESLSQSVNQPQGSEGDNVVWYVLKSARAGKYLTSGGDGNALMGNASTGTESLAMWKFLPRGDGTFDIQNRKDGTYISPASANNTALTTRAEQPAAGWSFSYSALPGTYIITSTLNHAQLNQSIGNGASSVLNWGYNSASHANIYNRDDEGCRYYITLAGEPTDPELVLTLTNVTLTGDAPYRVPDPLAQRVFALQGSMSVVVDMTLHGTVSGSAIDNANAIVAAVGSSDDEAEEYVAVTLRNNGQNVASQFRGEENHQEGLFTLSNSTAQDRRAKIVITWNKDGKHIVEYRDGSQVKDLVFSSAFAAWGFPTLGDRPNPSGLYLGGFTTNSGQNRMLAQGEIHSIRFYRNVLSAADVSALEYDGLEGDLVVGLHSARRSQPKQDRAYDLMGRPAPQPEHGVYIIGGKKRAVR